MLNKLSSDVDRFKQRFHFLQGDVSHKAFNYSVVNIYNGKIYMSPFIYENAQIYSEEFKIPVNGEIYSSILAYKDFIVNEQIKNSATKDCGGCKYLNICSQRLVPKIMDTVFKERKECILNKRVIELFDNEELQWVS
jgi:hypothetical protein